MCIINGHSVEQELCVGLASVDNDGDTQNYWGGKLLPCCPAWLYPFLFLSPSLFPYCPLCPSLSLPFSISACHICCPHGLLSRSFLLHLGLSLVFFSFIFTFSLSVAPSLLSCHSHLECDNRREFPQRESQD